MDAGELRPEEQFAAACLNAALPGVVVEGHDDRSEDSMYDLTLVREGEPFAACEVTATVDPNATALWKLTNSGRQDRWVEPALNKGWVVELTPACHVRTLKQKLPAVLVALEVDFWDWDARSRLEELGVGGFHPARTSFPGVIYCLLDRDRELTGGVVPDSGNPLVDWFEPWVRDPARADNLAKLTDVDLLERHLFVLAPALSTMPFPAYDLLLTDGAPLPTRPVDLPEPLTRVWFASSWSTGDIFSADAASWTRFHKPLATQHSSS